MEDLQQVGRSLERQEMINAYKKELAKLLPYLNWLREKQGKLLEKSFTDEGIGENSIAFPVYDGTLLNFIKALSATNLMNRNYLYDYRKYRITDGKGELDYIERADIKGMGVICSILSKYAIRGRTKGKVWSEGVLNGVYLKAILKLQELVSRYDTAPLKKF